MTTPWIREQPEAWDKVVLGGIVLPGKNEIDGGEVGSKWDAQPAQDTDGAELRYKGYENGSFSIVITLWGKAQWQDWLTLMPTFRPKPGKVSAKAYPVSHPELAAANITACVIEKIKWAKSEGPIFTVTLSCKEWFLAGKPTGGSVPSGGQAAGNRNTKPKKADLAADARARQASEANRNDAAIARAAQAASKFF